MGWQGLQGALCRSIVGSTTQLATFDVAKTTLVDHGGAVGISAESNKIVLTVAASLLSGLALTTAMEPFDTVTTRLCNQHAAGMSYAGPVDCVSKTFAAEGFRGLYKGWVSSYLRIGPHTLP